MVAMPWHITARTALSRAGGLYVSVAISRNPSKRQRPNDGVVHITTNALVNLIRRTDDIRSERSILDAFIVHIIAFVACLHSCSTTKKMRENVATSCFAAFLLESYNVTVVVAGGAPNKKASMHLHLHWGFDSSWIFVSAWICKN
jgi:hypothetical protein